MKCKSLRMSSMLVAVSVVGATLCSLNQARAQVIFVDAESEAVFPDGSSWDTAFQDLHEALDICYVVPQTLEVWVRKGVYSTSSQYILYDSCELYGGFFGTETQRDERDWNVNVTTLERTNNGRVLLRASIGGAGTVLDGFVVQNGRSLASSSPLSSAGGGIAIFGFYSHLLITDSVITNNMPISAVALTSTSTPCPYHQVRRAICASIASTRRSAKMQRSREAVLCFTRLPLVVSPTR